MTDQQAAHPDVRDAATMLRERGAAPQLGLVLGSGLGAVAEGLAHVFTVPYADIPGMPTARVSGHEGRLWLGELGGVRVACLQGRVHAYEGHTVSDVCFGVRLLAAIGCHTVLLTNAAGGLGAGMAPGDLMLITDHINLTGLNPLVGPNFDALGPRFLDMSYAYDRQLQTEARAAARDTGIALKEGIYAGLLGPTYETPAEVRMLGTLGASAVGMSTVLETIAARHLGVRVGGMSCITNLAAGISAHPLSHAEVKETADKVTERFQSLIRQWVTRIADQAPSPSPHEP